MLSAAKIPHNDHRLIAVLAVSTWLAEGIGRVDSIVRFDVAPYYYLMVVFSLVGIAGGLLYFAGAKRWPLLLGVASCGYLVLYFIRFYWFSLSWLLERSPFGEACSRAFGITSTLIQHMLSAGRYSDGAVITFAEWVMPVAQGIIMVAVIHFLLHRPTGASANGNL